MGWGRGRAGRHIIAREGLRSLCSGLFPVAVLLAPHSESSWVKLLAWLGFLISYLCVSASAGALVRQGDKAIESTYKKKIAAASHLPWGVDLCVGQGSIMEDGHTQIWMLRRKWPCGERIKRMSSLFALAHFFNTSVTLTFLKEFFKSLSFKSMQLVQIKCAVTRWPAEF